MKCLPNAFLPTGARRRKIEAALDVAKKTRNINIRISQLDLENIKRNAMQEGIPYQTLIASVLNRYLSGRLVDEASIRKTVELLSRKAPAR